MKKSKPARDESQTKTITSPVEYGIYSGPGLVNKLVPFREVDGLAIAEGDIVLGTVKELRKPSPNKLVQDEKNKRAEKKSEKKGIVIVGNQFRWLHNTMPYVISQDLTMPDRVLKATEHITLKTGFKFVKRTNQSDYVHFQWHASSSSSALGKRGRKQVINLADWATVGTTIHEIMHAMGCFHEQSRHDRDEFIQVHWTNLADGWASQYAQPINGTDVGRYDYCSIMHYSQFGGARPGLKAFSILKNTACNIGQRIAMSRRDILTIKRIYPNVA